MHIWLNRSKAANVETTCGDPGAVNSSLQVHSKHEARLLAEPCIKLGHVHKAKLCCKLKTHAAGSANNAATPWMHATSQHHHCATPIQDCHELVTTGMVSCVAWACHTGNTAAQQCKHYTNRVTMSGYWNTVKYSQSICAALPRATCKLARAASSAESPATI